MKPKLPVSRCDGEERMRRWRLILGRDADSLGQPGGEDGALDRLLEQLYEPGYERGSRRGPGYGYGRSIPKAAQWFAEIKSLFPETAVDIIQKDAMQRLDLVSLLQDPAFLETVQPDVQLVAQLLAMKNYIPEVARENARKLVRQLVEQLMQRYQPPMEQSVRGALNRARRNHRPRASEIDWGATVRKNLKHWQPEQRVIFPERLVGYGRKQRRARQVILCVDQSGSMASSVIYSSIFAAVISSMPTVRTHLVVFDTEVVDLTEALQDPVDMLFGIQLGGGTDIARAMQYCEGLIGNPAETQLILISDLYEGGSRQALLQSAQRIIAGGTNLITLLALSDEGAPVSDRHMAAQFTALGSPAFACTPDLFPALMATALERRDLHQFASAHNLPVTVGD